MSFTCDTKQRLDGKISAMKTTSNLPCARAAVHVEREGDVADLREVRAVLRADVTGFELSELQWNDLGWKVRREPCDIH